MRFIVGNHLGQKVYSIRAAIPIALHCLHYDTQFCFDLLISLKDHIQDKGASIDRCYLKYIELIKKIFTKQTNQLDSG